MPISEVFGMLIVFSSIAVIFKIVTDAYTRNKLISHNLVGENAKYLFSNRMWSPTPLSSVKWGMVLIGIGVALVLRELTNIEDETMLGLMFIFAGAAFLIYYALVKVSDQQKNTQV